MSRRSKAKTPGGFANAEIPHGFENPRSRLPDEPLSPRGRILYYSILTMVILGGAGFVAWLAVFR